MKGAGEINLNDDIINQILRGHEEEEEGGVLTLC